MKKDTIVILIIAIFLMVGGYFLTNNLLNNKNNDLENGLELSSYNVELFVGDTYKVNAKVLPENTKYNNVIWYSENTNIATVSNGIIKGESSGSTTIKVTTENKVVTKEIKVKVIKKEQEPNIIINNKEIEIYVGNSRKIDYHIEPTSATNKTVTWSSSNNDVATIDNDGIVLGKGVGTVTIKAKLNNGKMATCTVKVIKETPKLIKITSLKLGYNNKDVSNKSIDLNKNDSIRLLVGISPSNATNKKLTWTSSNKSVATVDSNGNIKAIEKGTAKITVATNDGSNIKVSVTINVIDTSTQKIDITKAIVSSVNDQKYTGKAITPKVTIKYNNKTLLEGTDYSLTYKDNINVGKATITITGKGNYKGTKTVNFNIVKESVPSSKRKVTFKLPASGMTFTLRSGIRGDKGNVTPTNKSSDGKTITYTILDGSYQYEISGSNYYSYKKSVVVSGKDITIDANPGLRGKNNYEPSKTVILAYADSVLNKLKISDSLKKEYSNIFTTPSFNSSNKKHEFTNATESKNFISKLNDSNDNMYVYSIDPLTVVIFSKTNLNSYSKVNDALKVLRNSNKLNIFYTAEVHGNEPAAGEGALAMIKMLDGTYGNKILDKVNIVIIPLVNPNGAKNYSRTNANNVDLNRDYLYSASKEIQIVHSVYNVLLPEFAVDGHEHNINSSKLNGNYDDVQIGLAYNLNRPKGVNDLATTVLKNLISDIRKKGLYPGMYTSDGNVTRPTTARVYNGLYGSISLLVETSGGGNFGKELWQRRVLSQYVTIEQYFNYAANHASDIKKIVANSRNEIVKQGTKFNSNNKVVIKHSRADNRARPFIIEKRTFNLSTGELKVSKASYGWIDRIGKSRPRPTAYVISKSANNASTAIQKLKYSGIKCYSTSNNTSFMLMQYSGSKTSASYSSEKKVTFPNGAYVCTMNQYGANILAMAMEPDNGDNDKASFVQRGLLSVSNIYRSHKDLISSSDNDAINKMKLPTVK